MLQMHAKLGISMDRMYCEINDYNHGKTSHDLYIHRQYKAGKLWFCEQRCRLCNFSDTFKIDHPLSVKPNVVV